MTRHGWRVSAVSALGVAAGVLLLVPTFAAEPLVVSIWGGHWKEVVEKVASVPFTHKTGTKVEYDVGETTDRLARARATKANPQADVTFTTSHVSRLYASDGLLEAIPLDRLQNAGNLVKEAIRSDTALGLYATIYTIAVRTDMIKDEITSWQDLWRPAYRGKIILPAFDPSHIIVVSALLSGGNEFDWERGWERLKALKANVAAFYPTGIQSIEMMRRGEAAIGVLNSPNIYRLQKEGVPVKLVLPRERAIVTMDVVTILKGTKQKDAALQYVDFLLSPEVQGAIAAEFSATPLNLKAKIPSDLRGKPGIFETREDWERYAYVMNDEQRAKMLDTWKERFRRDIMSQ